MRGTKNIFQRVNLKKNSHNSSVRHTTYYHCLCDLPDPVLVRVRCKSVFSFESPIHRWVQQHSMVLGSNVLYIMTYYQYGPSVTSGLRLKKIGNLLSSKPWCAACRVRVGWRANGGGRQDTPHVYTPIHK